MHRGYVHQELLSLELFLHGLGMLLCFLGLELVSFEFLLLFQELLELASLHLGERLYCMQVKALVNVAYALL